MTRLLATLGICLLVVSASRARTITEIIDASGDGAGNPLSVAIAIAVDAAGNVYVGGANSDNVFRVTPAGVVTEVIDSTGDRAGNGLDLVRGIAVDAAGSVYVAGDFSNNAFRIDTPTSCSTSTTPCTITKLIDASGDGAGRILDGPFGIAVDAAFNVFVIGTDSDNAFQITAGGIVTEIIDRLGDRAGRKLDLPQDVEVDAAGNVYVVGHLSDNVFRVDAPGGCSTTAAPCAITELIDRNGDLSGNQLRGPRDVAVDVAGNLYVTGDVSHNAFQVTAGGVRTELIDATGDGAGNPLVEAAGLAVDASGNVYVSGDGSDNVFRIGIPGACSTIATPCVVTEIIDATGDGVGNPLDGVVRLAAFGPSPSTIFVPGFLSHNVFEIDQNGPPVALCQPATVSADADCVATVAVVDIDAGSFDPDGPGDVATLCLTALDGLAIPCLALVDLIDEVGVHSLTLTIADLAGATSSCDAAVEVVDDAPPVVLAALEPESPRPAGSARSVCSPPTGRAFRVVCAVTDNCDPNPSRTARVLASHSDVPARGTCAPRIDAISVLCDEVVEIRLLPPACPAKPRSPRSSLAVNSAGRKIVFGERVVLEVTATDASGNATVGSFDPASAPSTLCDEVLDDGTCCPAVAQPAAPTCVLRLCELVAAKSRSAPMILERWCGEPTFLSP